MRLLEDDLARDLHAIRPLPSPELVLELDRRMSEGFERPRRLRLREPRRLFAPLAAAATMLVVIGVAVSQLNLGGGSQPAPSGSAATKQQASSPGGGGTAGGSGTASSSSPALASPGAPPQAQNVTPSDLPALQHSAGRAVPLGGFGQPSAGAPPAFDAIQPQFRPPVAAGQTNRKVETNAQLTLATDQSKVEDVANSVIDVTRNYGGIVMSSNVSHSGGKAEATFQLTIPSGHLQAALGALSDLAHVQSSSQGSLDITAPTASARRHLQDLESQLSSLRAQLVHAQSIGDVTTVQELTAKIRDVRSEADHARSALKQLRHRAGFSTVSVNVVSEKSSGGGFGIGTAVDDAGKVLRYAVGIAIISAAVMVPLALLIGLIALGWRVRIHRSREAALDRTAPSPPPGPEPSAAPEN